MGKYEDIVSLENSALTAEAGRRYEDALLAHSRALVLARELEQPSLTAVLFNRLGQALEARGDIQEAVIAYESGLKALAEESLDLEHLLVEMGAVGKGFQVHDITVPDLYRATVADDLDTAVKSSTLAVQLLINSGNAYLRQPQEDVALDRYRKALQRPEIEEAPVLRAYALANSGEILRRRGDVEEAEVRLSEAIRLLDQHGDPLEKRRALALLAGIARDRGQLDDAERAYQEALTLYAQADDPRGQGRTYAGLGRLYLEQGRFAEAEAAYQRALELVKHVRDPDTLWHAHWGLGRCQREAGRLDEAAASLQRSLNLITARQEELRTDEGKVTFLDSVQDVFEQLIAVHLERAQTDAQAYAQALGVAEDARGRALRDLMGGRGRRKLSREGSVRPSRLRSFEEVRDSAAQMAPGVPVSPPLEAFRPIAQMAPGIESGFPGQDTREQLAGAVQVGPGALPADGELSGAPESPVPKPPLLARLVFHVLADRTAVFAVAPHGAVRGHVADLGRDALSKRVAELRRALGVDDAPRGLRLARHMVLAAQPAAPTDPKPLLRELYAELVAPVAKALPTDGTPVVIEPHGPLWLLPFGALLADDGTWLGDQWPLLYSPSERVLDEIRKEPDYGGPADLKALIVGNPLMPAVPPQDGLEITLQPLPGAEEEAHAIAGFFPERHTLLLGADADRATVEKLAPRHGVLHLATHGVAYADDPLASFVALAEPEQGSGLWTAREALSVSLPADLVVLSACQTGLGRISGDGMIGLSRAFLVAGARAVLVSQWSVSDAATAALMTAFYRGYIQWDNKALALQRAMQALRDRPEYAHPRFWAPFVVVGAEA